MKRANQLYAIWPYDLFPYCIGGEVETLDDERIRVKGYGPIRRSKRVVLVPLNVGRMLSVRLKDLEREHAAAIKKVNQDFLRQLDELFETHDTLRP